MQLILDEDNLIKFAGLFLSTILIIYLSGQILGFWSIIWLSSFKKLKSSLRDKELTLQQIKQRDEYFCYTLYKLSELNSNTIKFSNLNKDYDKNNIEDKKFDNQIYRYHLHIGIIDNYTQCLKMIEYFNSLVEKTTEQEKIIKVKYQEIFDLKNQVENYQKQLIEYDMIIDQNEINNIQEEDTETKEQKYLKEDQNKESDNEDNS